MLTVATGPSLPYIDNDHVIFPNNVQQLTLVVRRKGLREPRTKELHEARKAGCYVSVVLDIVRSQKPRRGIDIATDQNRRVEIPDDGLIARGQLFVSPGPFHRQSKQKEGEHNGSCTTNGHTHLQLILLYRRRTQRIERWLL
jgi:hypothetical protein